ncbi:MAG: hypothetical protein H6975_07355 [Gammaproteobacteria bacterium]|nr:hypothetical protein [Gammaproteobacteria bacterium]
MKAVLLNYADANFASYQHLNTLTGRLYGFDQCYSYGPDDIDPIFRERHARILEANRGAGYWLWKPYFLARTLTGLATGDLLFYADAAMHFVNRIDPMIELMEQRNFDLLILGEGFSEAQYTKRDAFVLMEADSEVFARQPQRFASAFMLRNCAWSRRFVAQFLAYAEDARILTDRPNTCGLPDYSGFITHRHDQSIFSLLTKQHSLECIPSSFVALGHPDRMHQILNHTRTHIPPREIAIRLLAQGVLSLTDLQDLSTDPAHR